MTARSHQKPRFAARIGRSVGGGRRTEPPSGSFAGLPDAARAIPPPTRSIASRASSKGSAKCSVRTARTSRRGVRSSIAARRYDTRPTTDLPRRAARSCRRSTPWSRGSHEHDDPSLRGSSRRPGTIGAVTVDLATLPAQLADAVRAARGRRRGFVAKPLVSKRPDELTAAWTAEVIESGEIDAAISEVAAANPDLRS